MKLAASEHRKAARGCATSLRAVDKSPMGTWAIIQRVVAPSETGGPVGVGRTGRYSVGAHPAMAEFDGNTNASD